MCAVSAVLSVFQYFVDIILARLMLGWKTAWSDKMRRVRETRFSHFATGAMWQGTYYDVADILEVTRINIEN